MKLHDIRTLTLLQEMNKEDPPTQRELADRLDISLGLVNLYLKRLVQKSYFKVTTYPKKRLGYLLTPKGITEKSRLTYQYIQYSLGFYSLARTRLRSTLQDLAGEGVRTIAIYGANEIAEIAYLALKEADIELVAVIDDDKTGEKFIGLTIVGSKEIENITFDRLLDTSFTIETQKNKSLPPVPRAKYVAALQD